MKQHNKKRTEQLGMPIGTASAKLRKTIVFNLLKQLNQNFCFQCGSEIESEKDLSIEHKVPYLDSEDPKKLFFDLENIAFSHLSCNVGAARKEYSACGTRRKYITHGCRCEKCTSANTEGTSKYRKRKRSRIRPAF